MQTKKKQTSFDVSSDKNPFLNDGAYPAWSNTWSRRASLSSNVDAVKAEEDINRSNSRSTSPVYRKIVRSFTGSSKVGEASSSKPGRPKSSQITEGGQTEGDKTHSGNETGYTPVMDGRNRTRNPTKLNKHKESRVIDGARNEIDNQDAPKERTKDNTSHSSKAHDSKGSQETTKAESTSDETHRDLSDQSRPIDEREDKNSSVTDPERREDLSTVEASQVGSKDAYLPRASNRSEIHPSTNTTSGASDESKITHESKTLNSEKNIKQTSNTNSSGHPEAL